MIMDEPTASLAQGERELVFDTVRRLRDSDDVTFIYCSHFLDEVLSLTDKITVLRDGLVVADEPTVSSRRTGSSTRWPASVSRRSSRCASARRRTRRRCSRSRGSDLLGRISDVSVHGPRGRDLLGPPALVRAARRSCTRSSAATAARKDALFCAARRSTARHAEPCARASRSSPRSTCVRGASPTGRSGGTRACPTSSSFRQAMRCRLARARWRAPSRRSATCASSRARPTRWSRR